MVFDKPRLVIAALRGGSGKTVVSLGLMAAWRLNRGLRVIPFKKGPDYIDSSWLSVAARHPCYNLDPFLMKPEEILGSFIRRSEHGDISLIEGNRGLYDGVDIQGSFSTAELAKLLGAPVILVLDATKVTRTAAAMVLGCRRMDPEVCIAGVILNQVAGRRHEQVLRGAIEATCDVRVVGVIPKEVHNFFPERHLGLVPPQESRDASASMEFAARKMADCVDLDLLWEVASRAAPLGLPAGAFRQTMSFDAGSRPVVGVVRDTAFQFYYPENIEVLEDMGAKVVEISSFDHKPLPALDALYIGGGFPETHLESLAENESFRASVKVEVEKGLPVYAECGGLMFLCRSISSREGQYPMAGVFPCDIVMKTKPQGHGYTVLECVGENAFFAKGETFKGHEFHYSMVVDAEKMGPFVFRLAKGHGIIAGWDGMCYKRALACYSHVHAVGNARWAAALMKAALAYRREKRHFALDRRADPDGRASVMFGYSRGL
jgi:cobyrinic acid a,c-diamide synthase